MIHRRALVTLVLVFVVSSAVFADNTRRDGNWWIEMSRPSKISYMIGFFDGMDLGNNFSYWGLAKDDSGIDKIIRSYDEYSTKYLKDVTNGQIVDGLDDFYKDYRNRRIVISSAVWLVLNGVAGTPKDKLDAMIENFRRNAQ